MCSTPSTLGLVAMLLLPSPSNAQPQSAAETYLVTWIDLRSDANRWVGKRVHIPSVQVSAATFDGTSGVAVLGKSHALAVDLGSMNEDGLRHVLTHCSGLSGDDPDCLISVAGRLVSRPRGSFLLTEAVLTPVHLRGPASRLPTAPMR